MPDEQHTLSATELALAAHGPGGIISCDRGGCKWDLAAVCVDNRCHTSTHTLRSVGGKNTLCSEVTNQCFRSLRYAPFSRSNSSATTLTSRPSPWKSPMQTDRRRNESAWQKRRSRPPSLAYRHFTLISRETTSSLLIHEDIASAMIYGPFSPVPKNTDAYTHTWSGRWLLRWAGPTQELWLPLLENSGKLNHWGTVVSYGNVLPFWDRSNANTYCIIKHTRTYNILLKHRMWQVFLSHTKTQC